MWVTCKWKKCPLIKKADHGTFDTATGCWNGKTMQIKVAKSDSWVRLSLNVLRVTQYSPDKVKSKEYSATFIHSYTYVFVCVWVSVCLCLIVTCNLRRSLIIVTMDMNLLSGKGEIKRKRERESLHIPHPLLSSLLSLLLPPPPPAAWSCFSRSLSQFFSCDQRFTPMLIYFNVN